MRYDTGLSDILERTMTVKASISISEQQDAYVRKLVEEGHFSSLSEVVQHGLELVREETEMNGEDLAALNALLKERLSGDFLTWEESHQQIEALIAEKKKEYGV